MLVATDDIYKTLSSTCCTITPKLGFLSKNFIQSWLFTTQWRTINMLRTMGIVLIFSLEVK